MNRTLMSLAIIKSNWEKNKTDYIDNFVPLITSLAIQKNYKEIQIDTFQKDFFERFGLKIPIYAFITIFNRAGKKGIFKRENGIFYLNKNKIEEKDFAIESSDIERKFNKVILAIIQFAQEKFKVEVNKNEIEEAFLAYLHEHDLDILFAAKDKSVLPLVHSSKKNKYLINTFILFAVDSEPELFQILYDISIGNALAGTILYSEINSFSGKLKNLNVYLDTSLILSLTGFNGSFRKSTVEELINILNHEHANIFILDTNRGEVDSILNDCHDWLERGNYEIERASRILRYCIKNGITASDVEQKIISLDSILKSYKILSSSVPAYMENKDFQIDEQELIQTIENVYKKNSLNYDINDYNKKLTIERDVKVLSGIYRFRQGYKPKTIKDSKYVFVTSNTALAFASRVFETRENGSTFTIPTCLTDIFLATMIWLQSPQEFEILNKKKFISDCYSATQPSSELIKKYMIEVEKLKKEKAINQDEYYLLRTHRATLNLLEKKTMADPDFFDGSTTEDILSSIIQNIKGEESQKYDNERKNHNMTKDRLSDIETKNENLSL